MRANAHDLYRADVVAAFENQDDADEAVLQLRLAGLSDNRIGYYVQDPAHGLTDLIAHDRRVVGALVGGILGTVLGVWAGYVWNLEAVMGHALRDNFGATVTLGTCGALFLGVVGWWLGTGVERRSVRAPAVDPKVGAFILAVSAGALRDRAWALIRQHGGHEVPPEALTAQPIAV
jgi:hypothetical protein